MIRKLAISAALGAATLVAPASAQPAPRAIVSIYHAAPGQQEALLTWLAQQERVAADAGVPPSQLYVHMDGAEWDYVLIGPATTDAQDAALEAAGKKLGIDQGPRSGLAFRKYIMSHSDTMALGPTTAAKYLATVASK